MPRPSRLVRRRLADLEPDRLQLAGQRLDVLVGQIVLQREDLELRRQHVTALLSALEEDSCLLALQQLLELVLGQRGSRPFDPLIERLSDVRSDSRGYFLVVPEDRFPLSGLS